MKSAGSRRFHLWARSFANAWGTEGYALIWLGRWTLDDGFIPVDGPHRRMLIYDGEKIRARKPMITATFTGAQMLTHFAWATALAFRCGRLDREIAVCSGDTVRLTFTIAMDHR